MIKLKVKYFGMIQEAVGCSEEEWNIDKITVGEMIGSLKSKYPKLNNMTFKMAVNQELKSDDYHIDSDCELALLPPFAGG